MSRDAGMHHETVTSALGYLGDAGLLVHVRNRARGLREWNLTFPQNSDSSNTEPVDNTSEFGSEFRSEFGPSETTSVDLRRPKKQQQSFAEFNADKARSDAKGQQANGTEVRSIDGLAQSIAKRSDFVEESRHQWVHLECPDCDQGYRFVYAPGSGLVAVRCTTKQGEEHE